MRRKKTKRKKNQTKESKTKHNNRKQNQTKSKSSTKKQHVRDWLCLDQQSNKFEFLVYVKHQIVILE